MEKIIIFDDKCGICNFAINFVKAKSIGKEIVYIQNSYLPNNEINLLLDTNDIKKLANETVIYIDKYGFYTKIKAIAKILIEMKFPYRLFGKILNKTLLIILLNPLYDFVARNRSKISRFFRLDRCKVNETL